jgi:hypothetical protein
MPSCRTAGLTRPEREHDARLSASTTTSAAAEHGNDHDEQYDGDGDFADSQISSLISELKHSFSVICP